jgi:hypothetical protein
MPHCREEVTDPLFLLQGAAMRPAARLVGLLSLLSGPGADAFLFLGSRAPRLKVILGSAATVDPPREPLARGGSDPDPASALLSASGDGKVRLHPPHSCAVCGFRLTVIAWLVLDALEADALPLFSTRGGGCLACGYHDW